MKRKNAAFLLAVLMILSLTACGGERNNPPQGDKENGSR